MTSERSDGEGTQPVETEIRAVTVYPDRARVTRAGRVKLEKGAQELEIGGLPVSLNPDSVRARARGYAPAQGDVPAQIAGVQMKRRYYSETPDEKMRQIEAQIEALEEEIEGLEAQAERATRASKNLEELAGRTEVYAVAVATGEMSIEDQLGMLERLRARSGELDEEAREFGRSQREVEKRLEKLKRELAGRRETPGKESYSAVVSLEMMEEGDLEIEVSYVTGRAGWQPQYDLRLRDEGERAMLDTGYLGQVRQRSGEDWEGVALTLSTARPALAGVVPELEPWYLRPLPPPRPGPLREEEGRGRQMGVQMAPASMQATMPEREEPEVEAAMVMAEVESSGAAVTYRIGAPASVPGDGEPHGVSVAELELEAEMDYVIAPKLVKAAYRRARARNTSAYTLLPGRANLFAGEEFVGSTRMELVPAQGELEVYFGSEDRLRVERELKRQDVDKKLIGARRRARYGYEIRLENYLQAAAKVALHDQIPTATHEEIKVALEGANPQPSEVSELHELVWELQLEAEEKKTVRFDFSVEYPQEMELFGLP